MEMFIAGPSNLSKYFGKNDIQSNVFLFEKDKSADQQLVTSCLIPWTFSLLKLVAEDIMYNEKQLSKT